MSDSDNSMNKLGQRLQPPDNPSTFIGKKWRRYIVDGLNSFWNPQILIKTIAADGVSTVTTKSKIVMSQLGWVATLDLTSVGSGASSSVPFSGSGAPSATTLSTAFSYTSGSIPSLYVDISGLNLYACTASGSNVTSTWAMIIGTTGGGGSSAGFWNHSSAYSNGAVVQIVSTTTYGGVTILPGTYALVSGLGTPANPTGNQIPQFPYPTSGTLYWLFISPMPQAVNACASGGSTIYIPTTGGF